MEIETKTFETLIKTLLAKIRQKNGDNFSDFVRESSKALCDLGLWDETKYFLKDFILTYWGFNENIYGSSK